MRRRPWFSPETATYARFQRKPQLDLSLGLRQSRLPAGMKEGAAHIDSRTRWDHLFAKAVSSRPPDCAAKVLLLERPEIQKAKAAATPGSWDSRRCRLRARPPCRAPEIQLNREGQRFRQGDTHAPLCSETFRQWFAARETRFGHPDPQNPSPAVGQVPVPLWSCPRP